LIMRRRKGRPVDGVLLLNKPAGMTSNQALQQAKRLFFAEKAGHTGSLDPMATGVLPLCFGEATKFSQFLLDADKAYRTTVTLGVTTETCDAEGAEIERHSALAITQAQVEQALDNFRGPIQQVPPMYSALKRDGQPLYKLARQGVEVEREARDVVIFELELLDFRPGETAEADLYVRCSKGTYIRSLAHDLGQLLGVGGHVSRLHRVASGEFTEDQCISLETLHEIYQQGSYDALDEQLQPADAPVSSLPAVILPVDSAWYFRQGNPVMQAQIYRIADQGDIVRVFCAETDQSAQRFLGLGEITDDGRVAPKRIIANPVAD
jgi:tRNA pseudouridine55 synthase